MSAKEKAIERLWEALHDPEVLLTALFVGDGSTPASALRGHGQWLIAQAFAEVREETIRECARVAGYSCATRADVSRRILRLIDEESL